MGEGLRFECQPGCTECCRQRGFVYLTEADLARAAEFVGMTTAAFERKQDSSPVFTVAYVVRAVSPGTYVLPQAVVEDMYRPDRFGRTATGAIDITAGK